ncbi:MAG TPA: ABC transporter permease [Actinomycetales bacterium]|nr:ABC transporter permease [Actinomycetales bacterium]
MTAAPVARRVRAQGLFEARVMLRNGEQVLLTLVLPALLLVGLARTSVVPIDGAAERIDLVAPGVLALAVMSTAFTGQAIGTAFDRRYGVLRLLATTPLGRGGLLAGKVLAVLAVIAVQVVVLGTLAAVLGWRPAASGLPAAVVAVAAGAAAFTALGLLLAGTVRAEGVLAGANLLWVLLVVGGGVVVPASTLPAPLSDLAPLLPSGALGDAMRAALTDGAVDGVALVVLVVWAVAASAAVRRWFRWA